MKQLAPIPAFAKRGVKPLTVREASNLRAVITLRKPPVSGVSVEELRIGKHITLGGVIVIEGVGSNGEFGWFITMPDSTMRFVGKVYHREKQVAKLTYLSPSVWSKSPVLLPSIQEV